MSRVIDSHVHVGLRGDSFGLGAFSDYFMAQPAFKVFLAYAPARPADHRRGAV